jgi:hypothetical protein
MIQFILTASMIKVILLTVILSAAGVAYITNWLDKALKIEHKLLKDIIIAFVAFALIISAVYIALSAAAFTFVLMAIFFA